MTCCCGLAFDNVFHFVPFAPASFLLLRCLQHPSGGDCAVYHRSSAQGSAGELLIYALILALSRDFSVKDWGVGFEEEGANARALIMST